MSVLSRNLTLVSNSIHGAEESLKNGVTFLVDNTNYPEASLEAFTKTGLKGVIAAELFGSDPDMAHQLVNLAKNKLNSLDNRLFTKKAFSPHSLYSVSPSVWHSLTDSFRNTLNKDEIKPCKNTF